MTRDELKATLTMLRTEGVSKYDHCPSDGDGFRVEFFPSQPIADRPAPSDDPELCACKHSLPVQHVNGLCVEGCTTEECNPEPKP